MSTLVDISKIADISLTDTDLAREVDFCRGQTTLSAGPYMPILSGNYEVIAIETSDFQSFTISAKH